MNAQRVASIGSTVLIVVAVGLAASTLGSSMSTDPADAIDVDVGTLPLDDDSAGALRTQIQTIHDQYTGETTSEPTEQSGAESPASGGSGDSDDADTGGESGASDSSAQGAGPGQSPGESLLDELLTALLLLIVAVGVAYRYRERLLEILQDADPLGIGGETPAIPAPENAVEEAWVELVTRAGVPRPRMRTPRDCARVAVEKGYDSDAVYRLCRTFEEVSYGGRPPTDEQERIARETINRLDGEAR